MITDSPKEGKEVYERTGVLGEDIQLAATSRMCYLALKLKMGLATR